MNRLALVEELKQRGNRTSNCKHAPANASKPVFQYSTKDFDEMSDEELLQYYQPNSREAEDGLTALHLAVFHKKRGRNGISYAPPHILKRLLDLCPADMIRQKDNSLMTPLHRSLAVDYFQVKEENFLLLLEACPEAARWPDVSQNYPLHTSCHLSFQAADTKTLPFSRSKSKSVVQALVKTYPEAILKKNNMSHTPLHIAISSTKPSLEIIECLLQAEPRVCRITNAMGRTPLSFGLIWKAPADCLSAILKASPTEASKFDWETGDWHEQAACQKAKEEEPETIFRNGNMPLHLALPETYPFEFLQELLDAYPEAAKIRDGTGYLPLQLAVFHNAPVGMVQRLLQAYPAAVEFLDPHGWPILHEGLTNSEISPEIVQLILLAYPEVGLMVKRDKYVLPLHVAVAHAVDPEIVSMLIANHPKAVVVMDYYHKNDCPIHLGLFAWKKYSYHQKRHKNSLENLKLLISANPEVVKARDRNGHTPLFFVCELLHKEVAPSSQALDLLREIYEIFPEAAEMACSVGASPIHIVVDECSSAKDLASAVRKRSLDKLRLLITRLRDGRVLRPLCSVSGLTNEMLLVSTSNGYATSHDQRVKVTNSSLRILFLLSAPSTTTPQDDCPSLDLNRPIIPGWTLLEILADFDTDASSEVLLQIVEQQRKQLRSKDAVLSVTLKVSQFQTKLQFRLAVAVQETILAKVADRARLAKTSDRLRKWGQEYGRFLGRYRLERAPKHVSETCVVIFGTEGREEKSDDNSHIGSFDEFPVALKFMHSKEAFHREIDKRATTQADFVMPIQAFFTNHQIDESREKHSYIPERHYDTDLQEELAQHAVLDHLDTLDFEHLLVMERGAGIDLHDVVNHQNIAGRDVFAVITIALEVAKILRFLNETCRVIHGDVKARNFVAKREGFLGFRAIDLDNAASIDANEEAGQKRTSSGYLPPEMAAVEKYHRLEGASKSDTDDAARHLDNLKAQLQSALAANDIALVAKLSQEYSQSSNQLQNEEPPVVIASGQYDMWCFGTLLYFLFTGIQIFNIDVREELVETQDLERLIEWSDETKQSKLAKVGVEWPKQLLSSLLEKDPQRRPQDWSVVIDELEKVGRQREGNTKPGNGRRKGHVFVSYTRRDSKSMLQIYNHLVQNEIPTWMDAELTPGTPGWTKAIEDALRASNLLLLICSPKTKESNWVAKEILHALDLKVPILPVLIEGDPTDSIPFAVYDFQHIDARGKLQESLPTIRQSTKNLMKG